MALMCIPAPTLANIITSPLLRLCSLRTPFLIKSNNVGTVATELLPNL